MREEQSNEVGKARPFTPPSESAISCPTSAQLIWGVMWLLLRTNKPWKALPSQALQAMRLLGYHEQ